MNDGKKRAYISTITGVREVALTGTAELGYWRDRLRGEGLAPLDDGGRAVLLLTAIAANFRGIPFRELSISVALDGGGAFLAYAFNSSRLLGFAERFFFRTPYHLADLAVDERVPARLAVASVGRELFNARMGTKRPATRREDAVFDGPIYLPGGRDVFFARLSGPGDIFLFDEADTLFIRPASAGDIFARLIESDFTGQMWLARAGAVHARTKTFERDKGRA